MIRPISANQVRYVEQIQYIYAQMVVKRLEQVEARLGK